VPIDASRGRPLAVTLMRAGARLGLAGLFMLGANDAFSGNTETVKREIGPGVQIDLNTVGVILMVVGAIGLVLSLVFWSSWGGFGGTRTESRTTTV